MAQSIDESRAQLISDQRERAEELAQLNRIAVVQGIGTGDFTSSRREESRRGGDGCSQVRMVVTSFRTL